MERSEGIAELAKALSKFQGAVRSVPKTSLNPFYKSKYADLDAIWEMCRKPLSDNMLCLIQTPLEVEGKLYLETMLLHSTGEWLKAQLPINAQKSDPQSVGSAITYARRYAMSAMLGISTDEDDDANAATVRTTAKPEGKLEVHAKATVITEDPPAQPKAPAKVPPAAPNSTTEFATEAQRKAIFAKAKAGGNSEQELQDYIKTNFGVDHTKNLTRTQASQLIEQLDGLAIPKVQKDKIAL